MTISRSGEKRKSPGGIAPPAWVGELQFDDCLGLDLHQHEGIDEGPHLDHRRGRPDVFEELPVGAPDMFPVACDVDHIDACAHDTRHRRAEMREGTFDVLECLHGLGVRVAGANQRAVGSCRGGAGDMYDIADHNGARVTDDGLVFGAGIEVLTGHCWTGTG